MDTYRFAFARSAVPFLAPLGVTPGRAHVTVDDSTLAVVFGRWGFETPLANISCIEITRRYRWVKAIGLRGSYADGGITFGTNADAGVCVLFHEPIPRIILVRTAGHAGATMTVADVEGLAHLLSVRCALG